MARQRDFPARRWLSIALRSLHLAGIALLAAAILGHGASSVAAAALVLVSGLAMYAVDLWQDPGIWRELAGVFVAAKLALVLLMALVPGLAVTLFWVLLISSALISHAPRDVRHRRIFG